MRRLALVLLAMSCNASATLPSVDPGLGALSLSEFHPALILPSSEIDLVGKDFVSADDGATSVRITGTFTGGKSIDVTLPATFVDSQHLKLVADSAFFSALPSSTGFLGGHATVLVDSSIDRTRHASAPLDISVNFAATLAPRLDSVTSGTFFLNDAIALAGDGFLLGGGEGTSHAILDGCFAVAPNVPTAACESGTMVSGVDVAAAPNPTAPWDRSQAQFPFAPSIAGIHPGAFAGSIKVVNILAATSAGDASTTSASQTFGATIQTSQVTSISPNGASVGEYIAITGGGFIGAADDEVTLLHLVGNFVPDKAGAPTAPVDLQLVTSFASGISAQYVLDETDALGEALQNLGGERYASGKFSGTVTPVLRKGSDQQAGASATAELAILPVKQIVWLNFLPSYVDSLSIFGLTLADDAIRARIKLIAERDYQGINAEFRFDQPTDFALYTEVDVAGPDPNQAGLFGLDNTPGKDTNNERLFDKIGGDNATTQEDGSAGYGGVFAEEFMGFSFHPAASVAPLTGAQDAAFDQIFDPVRPDTGQPIGSEEVANVSALADGSSCPATTRKAQIDCAVFVFGSLVGTTLTHELGHALGLADPFGDLFHDPGDQPNRLMDAGSGRPFDERAELLGQGPARFCTDEFTYLQAVLPGAASVAPDVTRPGCD